QVQWDPAANRWFYLFLFCNAAMGHEDFHFGWSRTADPSQLNPNGWCNFVLGTTNELEDYPKLGHNDGFIIVGSNGFDDRNFYFDGANVFTIPKPGVGDQSCGLPGYFKVFPALIDPYNYLAATPVPVDVMTDSQWGYVLAATDLTNGHNFDNRIRVWPVDGLGNLWPPTDVVGDTYYLPPLAA